MSGKRTEPAPDRAELTRALGVEVDDELLERALTHRSYAYENGGLPTNERLEFLGDSVLGLVVTDTLYRGHPDMPEGQLAKLRAAVVNMRALAGVARALNVGDHIRLGRGEEGTGGRDKASILADTLEALIGAVYLDRGLDEASALVHRLFDALITRSAGLGAGLDWKTSLQELTAVEELGVPEYHVTESGPDHQKTFRAAVRVGGTTYGSGEGRSKKEAEQRAAEAAWNAISEMAAARETAAGGDGENGSGGAKGAAEGGSGGAKGGSGGGKNASGNAKGGSGGAKGEPKGGAKNSPKNGAKGNVKNGAKGAAGAGGSGSGGAAGEGRGGSGAGSGGSPGGAAPSGRGA